MGEDMAVEVVDTMEDMVMEDEEEVVEVVEHHTWDQHPT